MKTIYERGGGLRLKHPETIPKIIPQGWLYER